jgi:hypothetical protein
MTISYFDKSLSRESLDTEEMVTKEISDGEEFMTIIKSR